MIKLKDLLNEAITPKGWNQSKKFIKILDRETKNLKKYHNQQNDEDFLEVVDYMQLQLDMIKKNIRESVNEKVNKSDLKYQLDMSLDNLGIGTKALIAMKPKGKDFFLKMKSYMYQDSMGDVLKDANKNLNSKLKIKNFKKTRMGTEFVIGESVNEGKFSKEQIEIMRHAYSTLSKMNPSSPTYKKFVKFLDKLPKDELKQLANAKIKFVSILAKNRLKPVQER